MHLTEYFFENFSVLALLCFLIKWKILYSFVCYFLSV